MRYWFSPLARQGLASATRVLLIGLIALSAFAQEKPAEQPAATPAANKFEKEILAFEQADKKSPPPQGAIVFIGSSGIRLWKTLAQDFPDHKVINRGFGGSTIADAVFFADRIVIPCKPRLIVLRAGGNDINANKPPEQVAADFKAFVEKTRAKLPETRIIFMSINPSIARWANREREQKANALIKEIVAAGKDMDYIDSWGCMLGENGEPRPELYAEDKLHNSPEGYKLWTKIVAPYLK